MKINLLSKYLLFTWIISFFNTNVILLASNSAHAPANYKLFTAPGIASANYAEIAENIMNGQITKGSTLELSNGKKYTIEKYLGAGNLSIIISFKDEQNNLKALRIPKGIGTVPNFLGKDYQKELNNYYHAFENLNTMPVKYPVVEVDQKQFLKGEALVQDVLNIQFTYEEYKEYREDGGEKDLALDETTKKKVDQALLDFIKETASITFIMDLHGDQIIYNGEKWIILDGGLPISYLEPGDIGEGESELMVNLLEWDPPFGSGDDDEDFTERAEEALRQGRAEWARKTRKVLGNCRQNPLEKSFSTIISLVVSI